LLIRGPKAAAAPAKRGRPQRTASQKKAEPFEEELDDDDDESSDEEMEMDMPDQNQLYEDDEDRKRLEAMPEIEREAILAERFEKRKAELDMKAALRDAKRREKEEKKPLEKTTKKRKVPAAKKATKKKKEDETSNDAEVAKTLAGRRSSTRDRDANKKKESKATALAKLREERQKVLEQKADDEESESDFGDDDDDSDDDYDELKPWQKAAKAQEAANKRQKRSSTKSQLDLYEDEEEEDEDGVDEVDADGGRRGTKAKVPKAEVSADLEDFLKVTLSRRRLGMWCHEPFFAEAVIGSYVKLFIGQDENGKKCYRLCRIIGVTTISKPYDLPAVGRNVKPVRTDKMLTLRFQKSVKDFYIKLVSDNKVDESDVNQYITAMKGARLDDEILGKREATRIRRRRDELTTNYTYTKEDIDKNIKERKKKGQPMSNLGAEQTRVEIEVQAAREKVENAKRMLLEASESQQREAEELLRDAQRYLDKKLQEEEDLIEKVKHRKDKLKSQTTFRQWAKVNERAIRTNRQADVGAFKEKETTVELNANGKPVFNPYARRKVKPKILWEVGQKDEKKQDGDATGTASGAAKNNTALDQTIESAPSLVQEQNRKAAALSQSHQFTIDEEILAQTSFTSGMAGLRRKKAPMRVRKGLSLAEYQERKAAGSL
jgi:RNA polymerase-associated protein RTF1